MPTKLHLATTYLKILAPGDPKLLPALRSLFGDRAEEILNSEYLTATEVETVFNAFKEQGLESWLLGFGDKIDVTSHGALGFAVLSAPDLHTAMRVVEEFMVTRTSLYGCQFSQSDGKAEFKIFDQSNMPLISAWMIEAGMLVVLQLIESVMAHPLGEHATIYLTQEKPRYHKALRKFYGVECRFEQSENKIVFPSSWCGIKSPLHNEANFNSNIAKCRELKMQLTGKQALAELVSFELHNYFNRRAS